MILFRLERHLFKDYEGKWRIMRRTAWLLSNVFSSCHFTVSGSSLPNHISRFQLPCLHHNSLSFSWNFDTINETNVKCCAQYADIDFQRIQNQTLINFELFPIYWDLSCHQIRERCDSINSMFFGFFCPAILSLAAAVSFLTMWMNNKENLCQGWTITVLHTSRIESLCFSFHLDCFSLCTFTATHLCLIIETCSSCARAHCWSEVLHARAECFEGNREWLPDKFIWKRIEINNVW